jgi:hypothetical protein
VDVVGDTGEQDAGEPLGTEDPGSFFEGQVDGRESRGAARSAGGTRLQMIVQLIPSGRVWKNIPALLMIDASRMSQNAVTNRRYKPKTPDTGS